jgi:hypothetical protein
MVHRQEDYALQVGKTVDNTSHERPLSQVEWLACFGPKVPVEPVTATGRRNVAQVNLRDGYSSGRGDPPTGLSMDARVRGAQRLVPRGQLLEGLFERRVIESTGNPDGHGQVVHRMLRLQLIEEPEALLGE